MKEKFKTARHKLKKRVVKSPRVHFFSKFGFFTRGFIYFLFGLLGLEFSVGLRGQGAGFTEAIVFIQKQFLGQYLLLTLVFGLICFSVWSFLRAILDITSGKGRINYLIRLGYFASGFSYGALAFSSWFFFRGFSIKGDSQVQKELADRILYLTFGRQLLVVVGAMWAIAGLAQTFIAFKEKFKSSIDFNEMGEKKENIGILLGKIGIASRGFVFFLIGIFTIKAALVLDPSKAIGTEKVMEAVKGFAFGPLALGLVCGGLMMFGAFSIFQGIYFKFPSE